MFSFPNFEALKSRFAAIVTRRRPLGGTANRRVRQWAAVPEVLEVRTLLSAVMSATLDNGQLTVSDTDPVGKNNLLTVTVVGTDLVIADANEQFIAAPSGGTLSNGDTTLTIPLNLITSGLILNGGGGDDVINIDSVGAAFNSDLSINGDAGADTVTFQTNAVNMGTGGISVAAETINVNSPLFAGGRVDLTSTGDDTPLTINATVTAGVDSKFTSDRIAINSEINVGTHALTLVPESTVDSNDFIDIGSTLDSSANTLEISDEELDRITAGTIVIGDTNTSTISVSAAIQHANDRFFQVVTGRNIVFNSETSWATANGALSFVANESGTHAGSFFGIELNHATLSSTGAANITLNGHGGNESFQNHGIYVYNGAVISSSGTGQISLTGIGGAGTSSNRGVQFQHEGTNVTSVSGDIDITGQGGAGNDQYNIGVWLVQGPRVTSTGTARINIEGTGGSGTSENNGVMLNGFGFDGASRVVSQDGDISITGHGSTTATGSGNRGFGMYQGAILKSAGIAKIIVDGTGGTGSGSARGVEMAHAGALITSVAGDIQITGQGGANTSGYGFWMLGGAAIESTGTAKVTINGTAGDANDANGVVLNGNSSGTHISSVDGDITVIGKGGDFLAGSANRGIGITDGAAVQSTGLARIILNGTGGIANDSSRGVEIGDVDTRITSAVGDIQITGQGGAHLYGFGVWIRSGAVVESTGTSKVIINGTGGSGGSVSAGVILNGYGHGGATLITSFDGDIVITGLGGSSATSSYAPGVVVVEGSTILSTGAARILIDGTAGNGIDAERGVEIGDVGTKVNSYRGDITITGRGGTGSSTSGTYNVGVWLRNQAVVESLGFSGIGAKITINGTGGAGAGADKGIWMTSSSQVISKLGDISLTGQGGSGVGLYHHGINVQGSASIVSTGTAKITINGTGAVGTGESYGVSVLDSNTSIRSSHGDIQITGQAGSGGDANIGVGVQVGAFIESNGSAKITVNGYGGSGASSNHGVRIYGSDSFIRSAIGDIQVTGVGGAGTTFNSGVDLQVGGSIISTATARINVTGTGGSGIFDPGLGVGQVGVWILNSNSKISSQNGDIQIAGIGGGNAGTSGNHGVMLQSGVIETATGGTANGGTANVLLTGTAGIGSASFGIQVQSDSSNIGVNTTAGTGGITLVSDAINIDFVSQPGAISAGDRNVTILPKTNSHGINLGGADASGTLGLTDGELDRITAGNINIGNAASGNLNVTAEVTRPIATNMQLATGGILVIGGGQVDTHGGSLRLTPGMSPNAISPTFAGVDVTASLVTLDGALQIALNGFVADSEYTRLNVAGGINLNGVDLQLAGSDIPTVGDLFVIVNNDGVDPTTGIFNGLGEGAIISFNGRSLRLSYQGGSNGNDVTLTTMNFAPVLADSTLAVTEDTPTTGTLAATDVDSETLTYTILTNASHGVVNITNAVTGAYIYTPDANYNGPDSFTFTVSDGLLDGNPATVSIPVEAVNDVPQLSLNAGEVTFNAKAVRKGGSIPVLPNVTVTDPDQSAEFGIGGGTLMVSIDVAAKFTKRNVKLHDTIGRLFSPSNLGMTPLPAYVNGKLVYTVQLYATTTAADVQHFLRGITFATKGPGLKLTPRSLQVQITDAAGATSNLLQQIIHVTK